MIYASLRTVRAWADPWVPPVYLVLSVATGGLLANAVAHGFGAALDLDVVVLAALAGAGLVKARYWRSIDARGADSTPESATGLGFLGAVRLLDPPHTGIDYLMT